MKQFPSRFHELWNKYFSESSIADVIPVSGCTERENSTTKINTYEEIVN